MFNIGDRVVVHHYLGAYTGRISSKLNELEYYVIADNGHYAKYRTINNLEKLA